MTSNPRSQEESLQTREKTQSNLSDRYYDIIMEFVNSLKQISYVHNVSEVVSLIKNCDGKIITVGMGKAGIAMKKFSATLSSLGMPSCFLHPGEALHGDMGIIQEKDILFIASTSGKTKEIMLFLDLVKKNMKNKIIGITSHSDSPIREKADITLDMGEIIEAGHLRIAPTTSILVMLAITDALALVASHSTGLTLEDYGKCHHGGYLGKKARGEA